MNYRLLQLRSSKRRIELWSNLERERGGEKREGEKREGKGEGKRGKKRKKRREVKKTE